MSRLCRALGSCYRSLQQRAICNGRFFFLFSVMKLEPSTRESPVLTSKSSSGKCAAETFHAVVVRHPFFDVSIRVEVFHELTFMLACMYMFRSRL